MKRISVGILLLLTSLTLVAQQGGKSYGAAGAAIGGQDANGSAPAKRQFKLTRQYKLEDLAQIASAPACPIGMHATQGVWDRTVKVRNFDREITKAPFGQRIVLTLTDSRVAAIVSARVVVHGLNGKNHMVQTDEQSGPNATKVLHVRFTRQADDSVSADLYVPGFTSVSSVQLEEMTYADGSTWKISGTNVCRVTPDPMMLVAEH